MPTHTTSQIFPASFGGYVDGKPLMPVDVTGPDDSIKWIEQRLNDAVKRDNRVSWGQSQLKILADMLRDRGQDHIAIEVLKVSAKI